MGAKHHVRVLRHLIELGHENRTLRLQRFDHGAVMDNLMSDVDGGTVPTQRFLDDPDRPVHPGAKAPRPSQNDA